MGLIMQSGICKEIARWLKPKRCVCVLLYLHACLSVCMHLWQYVCRADERGVRGYAAPGPGSVAGARAGPENV